MRTKHKVEWVVQEAVGISESDLIACLNNCYSIENHAAHGVDDLSEEYVGTVYPSHDPSHVYAIYRGKEGGYWYRTMVVTERGPVELCEHIFGRTEEQLRRRRGK